MNIPLVMEPVARDVAKMSYVLRNPEKYQLRLEDVGVPPSRMNAQVRQRLYALAGLKDLWDDDGPKMGRLNDAWARVFGDAGRHNQAAAAVFRDIDSINVWLLVESLSSPKMAGLSTDIATKDLSDISAECKRAVVSLSCLLLPEGKIDDEEFVAELFSTARRMADDRGVSPANPRKMAGRAA